MRLDFVGERVLAVVAHPDDAELLCAGTLARANADGATAGICVLCRGDKGQPAEPIADLPAVQAGDRVQRYLIANSSSTQSTTTDLASLAVKAQGLIV